MVARHDVSEGSSLTETDLRRTTVEPRFLPPGVFLDPAYLVRRTVLADLLEGEIIRKERLADPEHGGLASKIPMGMRAIEVPSAGSPAQRESYVDVWSTPPGEGSRPCIVLHMAFVLFATPGDSERPARLGLLVTSSQALDVLLAARSPSFRVELRNDLGVSPSVADRCP